ncbi:MAG: HD-GYP domain-containing protein [Desulfurivibrionaceae bacterium]
MNHHKQVAHISVSIGEELGLPHREIADLGLAGAVHDIGGLSLDSRLEVLEFEVARPELHTLPGYLLLSTFQPFYRLAQLVRYHHQYWQNGEGAECGGRPVPMGAHILHLSDRIAVLVDQQGEILSQVGWIVERIRKNSGYMFVPEQVKAFEELAGRESFWLDLMSPSVCSYIEEKYDLGTMTMGSAELTEFTAMLSRLIDFRSRFTATHSRGVAVVAETLADKCSLSAMDCYIMKLAGFMHDIGKLVVPAGTLEKKRKLTPADFNLIRKHPYYSYRILQSLYKIRQVAEWSACHHERLDGTGYPFHLEKEELTMGSQVLAVADTFTALTEVRPYRAAMSKRGTLRILEQMAERGKLNPELVDLLRTDYDHFNHLRSRAQQEAYEQHNWFMAEIESLFC